MFEFDPKKSRSNKEKHGIDFETARRLWRDPGRIEIPARWVDETRFILIAELEDMLWASVFTYRKNRIRIISVRKSRDNEKKIYYSSRV